MCGLTSNFMEVILTSSTTIVPKMNILFFISFLVIIEFEGKCGLMPRLTLAPLLNDVLSKIKKQTKINSFVATGLCPLNPDRVDYTKCLEIETEINDNSAGNNTQREQATTSGNNIANNNPIGENRYKMAKSVLIELLPVDTLNNLIQGREHESLVKLWGDINCKIISESKSDTPNVTL